MSREETMESAIAVLVASGFSTAGRTAEDMVRVGTARCPVLGGMGGQVRTFGGRSRFALGDLRATVGPRTICIYRAVPGRRKPEWIANVPTRCLADLRAVLDQAVRSTALAPGRTAATYSSSSGNTQTLSTR